MPCSFVQIATITTLTTLPHDEHIAALVLDRKEDLRHHDENPPLVRWVDCPHTVHVGRVIPRVVGRLDVACVFPQLASTDLIWGSNGQCFRNTQFVSLPVQIVPFGKRWKSGYFCNVTRWWRHQSQWWCSPDRWYSSSDQTRTGRFQQGSVCSGECWSCSNVQERSALEEVTGQSCGETR